MRSLLLLLAVRRCFVQHCVTLPPLELLVLVLLRHVVQ
jgi:hypothetical protein